MEIYTVAALLDSGVMVAGDALGWPNAVSATLGAVPAICLGSASLRYRWNLPRG